MSRDWLNPRTEKVMLKTRSLPGKKFKKVKRWKTFV